MQEAFGGRPSLLDNPLMHDDYPCLGFENPLAGKPPPFNDSSSSFSFSTLIG